MTVTDAQLAKLPKWARDEIEQQGRKIDELRQQIDECNGVVGETDTMIENYGEAHHLLPRHAKVRFAASDKRYPDGAFPDHVTVYARLDHIEVLGSQSLAIEMNSANAFAIRLRAQ